jgi:hypothetical protein
MISGAALKAEKAWTPSGTSAPGMESLEGSLLTGNTSVGNRVPLWGIEGARKEPFPYHKPSIFFR